MYDIEKIKEYIKGNLSSYRYEHSLMVAEEAKRLAIHYGLDSDKAYVIGLLHDMAKDLDDEKNSEYISKYHIDSSMDGKLLHAEVGYYMAKEQGYDNDICDAIRYHTLGHPDMDMYAKIVLVADKIARVDINSQIEETRKLAYEDINKAIVYYLNNLKNKLESLGKKMHSWSETCLEELNK